MERMDGAVRRVCTLVTRGRYLATTGDAANVRVRDLTVIPVAP